MGPWKSGHWKANETGNMSMQMKREMQWPFRQTKTNLLMLSATNTITFCSFTLSIIFLLLTLMPFPSTPKMLLSHSSFNQQHSKNPKKRNSIKIFFSSFHEFIFWKVLFNKLGKPSYPTLSQLLLLSGRKKKKKGQIAKFILELWWYLQLYAEILNGKKWVPKLI